MGRIVELKQKRAKVFEDMKAVLDGADKEKRGMTGEEQGKYEKMEKEFESLSKTIDAEDRAAKIAEEMEKSSSPINPAKMTGTEGRGDAERDKEYRSLFLGYLRSERSLDDLKKERRDLYKGADAGALVPSALAKTMIDNLVNFNIMRKISSVISTSMDTKIPFVADKGEAVWIDEKAIIPESDSSFDTIHLEAHKLGELIKASRELLSDSQFDVEGYISKIFGENIGLAEERAFISGNGTKKPTGFLVGATVGVTTKTTAGFSDDEVMDLYYSVKRNFRANGVWLTSDIGIKALRKLKDSDGHYLWAPGLLAGQPDTLFGKPIYTAEMPEPAAGAKVLAFGDFKNYQIVDRNGIFFQRLGELLALTDQIGFIVTKRVDGKLLDPNAIKVLQIKA